MVLAGVEEFYLRACKISCVIAVSQIAFSRGKYVVAYSLLAFHVVWNQEKLVHVYVVPEYKTTLPTRRLRSWRKIFSLRELRKA